MKFNSYKLLIIDDEPVIADGLRMLFEEQAEMNLDVEVSYSSTDALNKFEKLLPDIVLSDIKMPGLTGLELVHQLKGLRSDTKVIFLTGYDYFEYAYEAIKQNAFDYILKTENDDKVIATVTAAISKLEHERLMYNEYQAVQQRLSSMQTVLRHNLLIAILTKQLSDPHDLGKAMAEVDETLHPDQNIVMILGHCLSKNLSLATKSVLQLTVENILKDQLQLTVASVPYMQDILWFIVLRNDGHVLSVLTSLLEEIQMILKDKAGSSVSFAIAEQSVKWPEISIKHQSLRRTLANNTLYEQEGIIKEGGFQKRDMSSDEESEIASMLSTFPFKEDVLETYLQNGYLEKFAESIREICDFLERIQNTRSLCALELYLAIRRVMLTYINQNRLVKDLAREIDLSLLFDSNNMGDWKERSHFLRDLAEKLCNTVRVNRQINTEATMARIKDYIHNNLSADLSLTSLGRVTGFNPTYLSRIFKRDEGIGLHEYISGCRIALAKSLLVGTRMKVYEISQKCGYDNSNYFIKTFKLLVGQTPHDYRKHLL